MMNEEHNNQQPPQPTIDQLILGLMWELQALRVSVAALTESVNGLNSSLREEEDA